MSDNIDNTTGNILTFEARKAHPVCRVSYTLNNAQPVRCSFIGEEPLFFMDHEGDFAEDAAFDDAFGFDAIEDGLEAIQAKILALDALTGELERPQTAAAQMEEFVGDSCDAFTPGARESDKSYESAAALENDLRQSRLAASYLDFAAKFDTHLAFSAQAEDGFYDREAGRIFIHPGLDKTTQVLLAVRELRRVWQHRNGALLHPLTFHPDQAVLVNRAQCADLSVAMVRMAWELQLAGMKEPWERIENSSMADLGRAFARESALDFRSLNNGGAASAVFEAWFLSDRCRHEDRRLIQQMLADFQGYVFEAEGPSRRIGAELIAALGTMPFGKNYLVPYVQTITEDPVFTEVRDRSNANFLWFIKFERTFRETEQHLQETKEKGLGESCRGDLLKPADERISENEQTATIVALPGSAGAQTKRTGSGAQIIEFKLRGPGE